MANRYLDSTTKNSSVAVCPYNNAIISALTEKNRDPLKDCKLSLVRVEKLGDTKTKALEGVNRRLALEVVSGKNKPSNIKISANGVSTVNCNYHPNNVIIVDSENTAQNQVTFDLLWPYKDPPSANYHMSKIHFHQIRTCNGYASTAIRVFPDLEWKINVSLNLSFGSGSSFSIREKGKFFNDLKSKSKDEGASINVEGSIYKEIDGGEKKYGGDIKYNTHIKRLEISRQSGEDTLGINLNFEKSRLKPVNDIIDYLFLLQDVFNATFKLGKDRKWGFSIGLGYEYSRRWDETETNYCELKSKSSINKKILGAEISWDFGPQILSGLPALAIFNEFLKKTETGGFFLITKLSGELTSSVAVIHSKHNHPRINEKSELSGGIKGSIKFELEARSEYQTKFWIVETSGLFKGTAASEVSAEISGEGNNNCLKLIFSGVDLELVMFISVGVVQSSNKNIPDDLKKPDDIKKGKVIRSKGFISEKEKVIKI